METIADKVHHVWVEALHDPKVTASGLIVEAMRRSYLLGREDAEHPSIDQGHGYKVGDRVSHKTAGAGSVDRIGAQGVHVSYDDGASGLYDHYWFRDHANLLSKI